MISKKNFYIVISVVVTMVILINLISYFYSVRVDYTADKAYTLSEATEKILSELKRPVTVTAYISDDLPPDISRTKEDFKDLLSEYSHIAGANFIYKIESPNDGQKAEKDGITPALLDVREKDQVKQQKIYFGAVIKMGTQKEVIPLIQPGSSMEYSLTTAIKKMSLIKKNAVGYLLGHGEASMQAVPQLLQTLSVSLDIIPVNLTDSAFIPENIKTLLIVAPKDTVPEPHFALIEQFLAKGGNIIACLNTVDIDRQTAEGVKLYTGFEDFFKDKGINVKPDFVRDFNCASIMITQQSAGMQFQTPVKVHYLPIITKFADISPLKGLEGVTFMFASSIDTIARPSIKFTVLATTSERSGLDPLPLKLDLQKEWSATEFQSAYIPIAVMAEGKFKGKQSKIVVVSDGDFAVNGEGEQAQKMQPDNINFLANLVEYLTDETGLAQLRNKGVTQRPIDSSISDSSKMIIKYLNFLAPIILSVLFGFYLYSKRKLRRDRLSGEVWSRDTKEDKN
jgi:gliding-associated putative ABC transporter substrate-binding component GldG